MALHRLQSLRTIAFLIFAVTAGLSASVAHAATSTFVQGATTWNNTASWADGDISPNPPITGGGHVPNLQGDVAILQQRVTTNATMGGSTTYGISLGSGTMTIGTLTVRNTNNEYTTALQTGTLVFDNGASPAQFNEGLGTGSGNTSRTRLNLPVVLNSNLVVTQDHNLTRNTVTEFVQQITADASKTLTKEGLGSLQFAYGGASDAFLGDVDIKHGNIRLINGSGTANTTFNQSKGILAEDGTQFQLGNGITSFNIAPGAEVKINGLGNSNPNTTFAEGALRFEQTALNTVTCNFNSPVHMQTTSKIYVAAADATAILTQELRGDGTAGLTKGGPGLLKLSTSSANGNPYAGTTNVSKGSLAVNNTVSTASGVGSGNVNVTDTGSGAALGGTGYIGKVGDVSNVTLTGGRLYPGDLAGTTAAGNLVTSVGTLTIHGDLTFDALSSLNIDMNHSAADKVIVDGAITLASAGLNFNIGTPNLDGSETFTLIDNLGAGSIGGVFGALNGVAGDYSEGMPVVLGSQTYHITYSGGTGNDVLLLGTAAGLPGDYNNNGVVDAADYVLWRKGGPLAHEVDNPGVVNDQDYTEWRTRFGNGNSGSGNSLQPAAVPEPATVLLVALIVPFFAPLVARRKLGRTRS